MKELKGNLLIIRVKNQTTDDFNFGGGDYQMANPQPVSQPKNMHSFKVSLCGKRKKITKGKYKGHEGIVKNILGNKVEFELAALCKVIHIPLENLNIPKKDLEMAKGGSSNDRGRGMTGITSKSHLRQNLMTPAHEPDTQFNSWGEN